MVGSAKTNEENPYKKLKKHIEEETSGDLDFLKKKLKRPALEKYNFALKKGISKNEMFPEDSDIYKMIFSFIRLRHRLVHYEFYTDRIEEIGIDLAERLTSKFSLNPFFEGDDKSPLIIKYLSYGCLRWGYDNCEQLVNEFYKKIGLLGQIKVRQGILKSSRF